MVKTISILLLAMASGLAAADEPRQEPPPGYEEAPVAGEKDSGKAVKPAPPQQEPKAPQAKPAGKARKQVVVQQRGGSLRKAQKVQAADGAGKKDDAPPGYEDAPAADEAKAAAAPAMRLLAPARRAGANAAASALQEVSLENIEELLATDLDQLEANANVKAYEQQVNRQIEPVLRGELALLKRIVGPMTLEQRREIYAIAQAGSKIAARRYAMEAMGVMRRAGAESRYSDPLEVVTLSLVHAARKLLPPEDAEKYQAEIAQRDAQRQQAGAKLLVAQLDLCLHLSEDQRAQLEATFIEKLPTAWRDASFVAMQGERYFPPRLNPLVLLVLTKKQQAVWNSFPKADYSVWFGNNQAASVDDFPLDEE